MLCILEQLYKTNIERNIFDAKEDWNSFSTLMKPNFKFWIDLSVVTNQKCPVRQICMNFFFIRDHLPRVIKWFRPQLLNRLC